MGTYDELTDAELEALLRHHTKTLEIGVRRLVASNEHGLMTKVERDLDALVSSGPGDPLAELSRLIESGRFDDEPGGA